jgi:pimeloyl-ACP methyl ester carboxylesterase
MMSGEGANQKRVVEDAEFPVAFVNGENDPFIRLGFFNTLNCASLWEEPIVVEGAGHAPFWERPDAFNAIFSRFLNEVSAQEARGSEKLRRRSA